MNLGMMAKVWVKKTIYDLHREFDDIVKFFIKKGFKEIDVIGKSLGAGILLTYSNPLIKKMVLWAPAINLSKESNIKSILFKKFKSINSFWDIKINKEDLLKIRSKVFIIHGSNDNIVPFSNSEKNKQELKRFNPPKD